LRARRLAQLADRLGVDARGTQRHADAIDGEDEEREEHLVAQVGDREQALYSRKHRRSPGFL